jgi:excinuclease ABC subunit C
MVALSKNTRRKGELNETVFRPNRINPVPLKPGSDELLFLQHIRDTAHRFVLSRQKQSRKKGLTTSRLEDIPGIGPKIAKELFNHFGSMEAALQASASELVRVPGIGRKKAESIAHALKNRTLQDRL